MPQRRMLHELIVQIVSERKILSPGVGFEVALVDIIRRAEAHESYKNLVRAGDFVPEKITAILDDMRLERLPLHTRAEQVMVVTGGPGSGKSTLVDDIATQSPEIYQSAVQINPDDYKRLLANPDMLGAAHASYTHRESSMIADAIMERLDARMAAGLPAPHVLMDVTAPHDNRMAFAQRFSQMTVRHGTAPAEETVQRVYDRGFAEDGAVKGRVLPTRIALESTANSSRLLPNIFDHPHLDFEMFNMDVPKGKPPTLVAEWDNDARRLRVLDPDRFLDFIERQNINTQARSPDELWSGADRSLARLVQNLAPYTDKGIHIDLLTPDRRVAATIGAQEVTESALLPSRRSEEVVQHLRRAAPAPAAVPSHSSANSPADATIVTPRSTSSLTSTFNRITGAMPHAAFGLSAYGAGTRALGLDEGFNQDIAASGDRALYARSAFGLDVAATGADGLGLGTRGLTAARLGGTSAFLNTGAARYALSGLERAALPLALGAGGFEVAAAVKAHDPARAAGATGCTVGGIVLGAGTGLLVGSESGPGAILTAIGGGIAGCVIGEAATKRYATGLAADLMGDPIDPDAARYGGLADSNNYVGVVSADSQAAPDSFMGRVLDENGDGAYSAAEHEKLYRALGLTHTNGQIGIRDMNSDHALTGADAVIALEEKFRERNKDVWSAQNDMLGFDADQLFDALAQDGTIPDPVRWNGREMPMREALRDPEFVQKNIEALEIKYARGDGDYSEAIAALRQLRALEPPQAAAPVPELAGPALRPGF